MLAELQNSLSGDVVMGLAQAAAAIVLCMAVVALCRFFAVHVEREAALSIGRGLVQMVFVGVVLALLLHGSVLVGALILLLMTIAAAVTASRRLKGIGSPVLLSFWAIFVGSGAVIAAMLATGTLRHHRQCHERLRSGRGAFSCGRHGACGSDRGRLGAWRRASRDRRAPRPKCGVCQLAAAPRHDEVAGARVDTRYDGGHGGIRREPCLCRHLSIHHRRHDPSRLRHHWNGHDSAYAPTCLFSGGAVDSPTRRAIAICFGKSLDAHKTSEESGSDCISAAVHESEGGSSRQFAATQHFGCFPSEADIEGPT